MEPSPAASVRFRFHPVLTLDSTLAIGIAGIIASFGGVWFGLNRGKQNALEVAKQQRRDAEDLAMRQRQDAEAREMYQSFDEALADLPDAVWPANEAKEEIRKAHDRMLEWFSRRWVLDEQEVTERVRALELAMSWAENRAWMLDREWRVRSGELGLLPGDPPAEDPPPGWSTWPPPRIDLGRLVLGAEEIREALRCFARHIDPPKATFPRIAERSAPLTDEDLLGLDVVRFPPDRGTPPQP